MKRKWRFFASIFLFLQLVNANSLQPEAPLADCQLAFAILEDGEVAIEYEIGATSAEFASRTLLNLSWAELWHSAKEACTSFIGFLSSIRTEFSFGEQYKDPLDSLIHQIFDVNFLNFCGYYKETMAQGSTPFGHYIHDKVRISYINGILNTSSDLDAAVRVFSETHGGAVIHYVFRPTRGWTNDLLNVWQSQMGIASLAAALLAATWRSLIEEMGGVGNGGTIIHYAHSSGAIYTYLAASLLTVEEQHMIHVFTIGSPSLAPNGEFASLHHYVSKRDGVSLVMDPIGYLSGLISDESNVSFLDSHWGIPFFDHLLLADTYASLIRSLGEQFLQNYYHESP